MNNSVKSICVISLWLASVAGPVFAQETVNGNTTHNAYDVSEIKMVRVKSDRPVHVTLVGSDDDSLKVDRLSDKVMRVAYSVSRRDGALVLTFFETTKQKQKTSREERETWIDHLLNGDWNRNNYRDRDRNDFQITLPKNLDLDINTTDSYLAIHRLSGSVNAAGSDNHFEIDSLGTDLKVEGDDQRITGNGIGGTVTINNHDGQVNLRSLNGAVSVKSDNSRVDLEDVRDSVTLTVNDGSGNLRNIRGNVMINGSNSRFELDEIHGLAKLTGQDNQLDASDIQGLHFDGSDTRLSIDHVNGADGVFIKNSDATVKLDEIHGPVKMSGSNLGVTLNYIHDEASLDLDDSHVSGYKIMKNITLKGGDTSIDLNEYQGRNFKAEEGSGHITLGISSRMDSISIKRRSGDVTIHMLESFNGYYHLVTHRGNINWTGRQNMQIRRNGDQMEVSGGNKDQGNMMIELQRGDIRIN
ncbi:MAG TPA: DUF4097 family beta strand repeat-containing protein [Balneolales bacterium]|nr:DUF4097 family beta strand repeat-containing protein [Balneolales bacterium]